MSDELRIRVPWVPPVSMNINAHTHWRRKQKAPYVHGSMVRW